MAQSDKKNACFLFREWKMLYYAFWCHFQGTHVHGDTAQMALFIPLQLDNLTVFLKKVLLV